MGMAVDWLLSTPGLIPSGPVRRSAAEVEVVVEVGICGGHELQQKLTRVVDQPSLHLVNGDGSGGVARIDSHDPLLQFTLRTVHYIFHKIN